MKILKVYIYKNIGETTELEIEVDNNITEDEAEEISKDVSLTNVVLIGN